MLDAQRLLINACRLRLDAYRLIFEALAVWPLVGCRRFFILAAVVGADRWCRLVSYWCEQDYLEKGLRMTLDASEILHTTLTP